MSNTIESTSVSTSVENYDYQLRLAILAKRKLPSNGITTSSVTANRQKLISALAADYRAFFPGMFGLRDQQGNVIPATQRLPEEIYTRVCEEVDKFIDNVFMSFRSNPDEVTKVSTRFVHKAKQHDVILRHTITRDEVIDLKHRAFGITLFIGDTKRRLEKYDEQKSAWSELTAEKVAKLEKKLASETATLAKLEEEIAKQSYVTK